MAPNRRSRRQATVDGPAATPLFAEGARHHQAGNLAKAEKFYRRGLSKEPDNGAAHHALGVLYAQSGRMTAALDSLRRATKLAPGNPEWLSDLGNALLALGRSDESVAAYERAVAIAPGFAIAHYNLANALRAAGKPDEAIPVYRRAAELSPEVPQIHANLGVTLLQCLDFPAAEAALARAVALRPDFAEAHYNLGIVYTKMGDFDRAMSSLREALRLDPNFAIAHVNLGNLALARDDAEAAIASYRRAIELAPDLVEAHANIGNALHDRDRFDEAADAIRHALAMDPDYVRGHVNLGITLERLDDYDGAIECYQRAMNVDPTDIRALSYATLAFQHVGRHQEAGAIFDVDKFVRIIEVGEVEGWDSVADFNSALAEYVCGHPTLMRDRPEKSTTIGSQSLNLLDDDNAAIRSLRTRIEREVTDYIATFLSRPGSPFAERPPDKWTLTGWGVVLDSGGHPGPHVHPDGAASGVYYVQLPASITAGSNHQEGYLQFGQVIGEYDSRSPLLHAIQPHEGRMVLFPSWFWHRTIPFESSTNRISIAFDAVRG